MRENCRNKGKGFRLAVISFGLLCSGSETVYAADLFEGYFRTTVPANCWESPSGVCHPEQGLNIKRRDHAIYYLSLHTEGNFGHICSFSAIAHVEKNALVATQNKCHVKVIISGATAEVETSGDTCDSFCGANVSLDVNGLKRKK